MHKNKQIGIGKSENLGYNEMDMKWMELGSWKNGWSLLSPHCGIDTLYLL